MIVRTRRSGVVTRQLTVPRSASISCCREAKVITSATPAVRGAAAGACVLLTAKGTAGEFLPIVSEESMRRAADSSGFVVLDRWPLSDGRVVTEWHRPSSCPL